MHIYTSNQISCAIKRENKACAAKSQRGEKRRGHGVKKGKKKVKEILDIGDAGDLSL